MNFTHLDPLIDDDGGHGMIFKGEKGLYLTFHSPNKSLYERPKFVKIFDNGENIKMN
jgi:5'(3')-deoxyribonucleotidase